MNAARRIGIIAGAGTLPRLVAQAHPNAYVIRLDPFWNDTELLKFPGINTRMDKFGQIQAALRAQDIHDVVLVGGVRRPSIMSLRPDFQTWSLLAETLISLIGRGDDALLRGIRRALERRGFTVRGVQDLVQGLTALKGILGTISPDADARADIESGFREARTHGAADKGQAVVVQQGRILDVEGRDGTNALIARCAYTKFPGRGPVLVKAAKPQQDRAIDLPTIGPDTVENAAAAGFCGIAVEAGSTLLADKDRITALADQYGLFIIGV